MKNSLSMFTGRYFPFKACSVIKLEKKKNPKQTPVVILTTFSLLCFLYVKCCYHINHVIVLLCIYKLAFYFTLILQQITI